MVDEVKYLGMLGDSYLFAENVLALGLTDLASRQMVSRLTSGIKEMAMDSRFWLGQPDKDKTERIASRIEEEIYKSNFAKVSNYKKWVLNYSLVMLCSILDNYENDLLENVIDSNPQLTLWTKKEEIIGKFRNENSQKERIKIFKGKLGITEGELFDFSFFVEEVRKKFADTGTEELISIYRKRDHAAHTNSYALTSIDELLYIKDLFDKLILSWSILFRRKWGVKSKMVELYNWSKKG